MKCLCTTLQQAFLRQFCFVRSIYNERTMDEFVAIIVIDGVTLRYVIRRRLPCFVRENGNNYYGNNNYGNKIIYL